jgi:hypothetical protein
VTETRLSGKLVSAFFREGNVFLTDPRDERNVFIPLNCHSLGRKLIFIDFTDIACSNQKCIFGVSIVEEGPVNVIVTGA